MSMGIENNNDRGRGNGNDSAAIGTPTPGSPHPSSLMRRNPSFFSSFAVSIRESFGIGRGHRRPHDDEFSVADDYEYGSTNDLGMWQGAALLTADCLGTGILALPNDVRVLGLWLGCGFLILNLPINLYAGTILSSSADYIERKQQRENNQFVGLPPSPAINSRAVIAPRLQRQIDEGVEYRNNGSNNDDDNDEVLSNESPLQQDGKKHKGKNYETISGTDDDSDNDDDVPEDLFEDELAISARPSTLHHDTATFDFIGMTSALFHKSQATKWVMFLFYTNIFLVLGDYILVMSHAVAALLGESWICIPQAGILASTLMFAVSQLRTMANLGRSASIISLSALFVVVIQCLYFGNHQDPDVLAEKLAAQDPSEFNVLRKLSAIGSIGFAVGSQKLFLNIRHELADRKVAPKSLAISLTAFGTFYVAVVLCAGPNPPGLLFDAIPSGIHRRIAGFFLWIHVVVSYAINSQAICASMDRIFFYRWAPVSGLQDHQRWMILTAIISLSAFFVANAIPFFKDLVALIGALTSVPLTLLLPAVYHRKVLEVSILLPTMRSLASYALLIFASIFMFAALVGSVDSILNDWKHHEGGFFSCH